MSRIMMLHHSGITPDNRHEYIPEFEIFVEFKIIVPSLNLTGSPNPNWNPNRRLRKSAEMLAMYLIPLVTYTWRSTVEPWRFTNVKQAISRDVTDRAILSHSYLWRHDGRVFLSKLMFPQNCEIFVTSGTNCGKWNTRVRPFFKVFEAQPSADRSRWAEYEDIKFFEFGLRLPLPLSDFRKI